jgi:hypothetical protein
MSDDSEPETEAIEKPQAHLELDWDGLIDLLNGANTRCLLWQISELAESVDLTDAEVDILRKMPPTFRMKITASLLDYAEILRETSRNLDTQLLRLTGELV